MRATLTTAVSAAQLDAVERPIAEARGMPNAAYTARAFYEFERDHLFAATWTALAFCDDHRAAGTVTPVEFMGLPLLIVGDADGAPSVFHNVCSHRGMRLVDDRKKTNGLIVCPYHSWSYALDGALKATPHIGGTDQHDTEGFCRRRHGLKPVRAHSWMGVLFVNLNGDAPAFEDYAAAVIARYQKYTGGGVGESNADDGLSFTAECNWKLAVENYCEAYHLPWIHPALNEYSPLDRHYCITVSNDCAGQGTNTFNPDLGGALPVFPNWPADEHEVAEYPTLYPNLLLGYQVNHFYALIIQPLDAERIREDLRIFYVGDGATDARYASARDANLKAWRRVFEEDIGAIEGMQRGRRSPGFAGGVFSPAMDAPTHHFHRWVARKYRAGYDTLGVG